MSADETAPGESGAGGPVSELSAPNPACSGRERPENGIATVHAAGAVVWRARPGGGTEVAVVHRPRYDDWSLPKGKVDPGETIAHTAFREISEETGLTCVLSRRLPQVTYRIPTRDGGRAVKSVDYFSARVRSGSFLPNEEVDELRWMTTEQAREQLSYALDVSVLDAFDRLPTDTATLLLVRHAKAGTRSRFSGDDTLRPLSEAGFAQRQALHTLLPLFGPERVHSAPRLRCEQTVSPLAEELGVDIGDEPLLSEEGYWSDPSDAVQRLLEIAAMPGIAVVCSQGGVIPDLVTRLAAESGLEPGEVRSKKASVWTLTFQRGRPSGHNAAPALHLAAADYLAEPCS
ncbi:8-oxo-dGTP diphosphatase [Halopolyspora algeriensis]|uniref:8-oxo-dGTP diphosphatase n=1 Tax=Halopolyspora algeriensis TaxID=1500506 RepID=A0A368VEM6_9ACTN|nr:bifunctional NUDIX hydrolase/histidine phosphatase family protein [Halopolyspora algeriensis]RCW39153.1 8-oxo-dGTP diphosphatase [Halopolyspora algeriensis]TQM56550.1 8-oxo-dGTP diphosphatase [Halopolyspora algeriensis]